MKLFIEIECDNSAFLADDGEEWPERRGFEIRQIIANADLERRSHGTLHDSNGNRVGRFEFEDD